jgi:hypothetical protein
MEEKQSFTTFDSLTVLGLIFGVFLIVTTIISHSMTDHRSNKALVRAQQLAAQILIGGYKNSLTEEVNGVRRIASMPKLEIEPVGRIGMDPWGMPYYYRVFTDKSDHVKVVVLSAGPNRALNTTEEYFSSDSISDMSRIDFRGDDIGSVQSSL